MNRAIVWAACLLAVFVFTERFLRGREDARRIQESTLRPLVEDYRPYVEALRAFQIEEGETGRTWTYLSREGFWYSPDYSDAFVLLNEANRFFGALLTSAGTGVGAGPPAAKHYGLAADRALKVRLLDGTGALLLEIWIGRSVPGAKTGESYVKFLGRNATDPERDIVYHAHADPRSILQRTAVAGRPPLIDPYVLTRALGRTSIVRIGFEKSEPYPFSELRREEASEPPGAGKSFLEASEKYRWFALVNGEKKSVHISQAFAYTEFLTQMQYTSLQDPRAVGSYGFEEKGSRLYLEDAGGKVDVLEVGGSNPAGNTYLRHRTTGQVFTVRPEIAEQLFPTSETLLGPEF